VEVRAVSSETRQYVEELLALSPWIAFAIAVAWCWVLGLRDDTRVSRAHERERLRRSEKKLERKATTNR
jgi:hypothetical protein